MLSVSGSGDGGVAAVEHNETGGISGGSSDVGGSGLVPGSGGMDESERSGSGVGNRWPRQETLALLKIRSDMDVAFRDSNLKGPLWEEVSRKMAELGFQRSDKKCKEKFENVFKYHKRTKNGRQSKPDAKSYRFFDQLEALENTPPPSFPPPPSTTATMAANTPIASSVPSRVNVSSTSTPTPIRAVSQSVDPATQFANNNPINTSFQPTIHLPPPQSANAQNPTPILSNSTSSSTSSGDDIQRRRGKKRKWKDYFQRLLNDVIQKQEDMQKKFLDTLEKRERERMAREDAWRVQEMARMNREHELLIHERSVAAAKEAALITFLHKVTEQHDLQIPITKNADAQPPQATKPVQPPMENPEQSLEKPQQPPPQLPQQPNFKQPPPQVPALHTMTIMPTRMSFDATKTDNGGDSLTPTSSSRWPKAEIEALINLRTNLDLKYQENGPKGPLWEEISIAMGRLGYNRNSKRCKEKWENINKYFKKVKESSKKRPEDSKTCPYFHRLDALYKERAKNEVVSSFNVPGYSSSAAPIMAQPEQQWPLPLQQPVPPPDSVMHDENHNESENDDLEEDNDGDDDEEEDERGCYEVVTNKQPFSGTN